MNWKLPNVNVIQKSVNYFKPGVKESATDEWVSSSPVVNDEEDDLGITHAQHRGTVPFRRVESAVHNFVDVALLVDLDRLHRHKCNIARLRQGKDAGKLQIEYENAGRTVKQLKRNVNGMETLRARVVKEDLHIFDKHLMPAKAKALGAVQDFLKVQANEEVYAGAKFSSASNLNSGIPYSNYVEDSISRFEMEPENPLIGGDINRERLVQLKGNQLVIESTSPNDLWNQEFFGDKNKHELFYGNYNSVSPTAYQEQFQLVVDDHKSQPDESWEKLQKDILDLHEIMKEFSSVVYDEGKVVDEISSNIETASENIQEGTSQLKKAALLKAAMFPVLGAVIGGVIGGPIGMAAGLKLGSVTTGVAAVGVTGTVVGYHGGKVLKKRQQDATLFEMAELGNREIETDTDDSYEFLEKT